MAPLSQVSYMNIEKLCQRNKIQKWLENRFSSKLSHLILFSMDLYLCQQLVLSPVANTLSQYWMTSVLHPLFLEIILEVSWPQTVTNIHIGHSHSILKIQAWWWTHLVQLKLWFQISRKIDWSKNPSVMRSQFSISFFFDGESNDVIKIQKFKFLRIRRNKPWFQPLASKG